MIRGFCSKERERERETEWDLSLLIEHLLHNDIWRIYPAFFFLACLVNPLSVFKRKRGDNRICQRVFAKAKP